jgi:hypothetical protein
MQAREDGWIQFSRLRRPCITIRAMPDSRVRIISAIFLGMLFASVACAQDQCPSSAEFAKSLQIAPSCKAAADLFQKCRWGSSEDVGLGAIVADKCKPLYWSKLTAAQKKVHDERIDLCAYEYERQQGTLFISETTSCHIDVAVDFATDPVKAAVPLPTASFDCVRAAAPLEKAICSDKKLGRADLVLGRVYTENVKFAKGADRDALMASERKWLKQLPSQCGLSAEHPSEKVTSCLRGQFESRFTLLDECSIGQDWTECLKSTSDEP